MASLGGTFNTGDVEARTSFEPLPTGDYVMQIIMSEWKETKSGSGRYIKLEFEILDGEHVGWKYWENLNLKNPNETAVKIAKQTMAEIALAVGIVGLDDTEDLHFKPLIAKITCKPRKDNPMQIENVARYKSLDGSTVSAAPKVAAMAPRAVAAAAPAAARKPWEAHKRTA